MTNDLLTESSVIFYLRGRGILSDGPASAVSLAGGVSNVVLVVSQGEASFVVKQSLPRLRVEAEWLAPVERVITEGKAIVLASELLGTGPGLWDSDPERYTITMDRAPSDWTDWKQQLMSGVVNHASAAAIGSQLGRLHEGTFEGAGLDPDFFETAPFELLRLDPYYRATAARAPGYADRILASAAQLRQAPLCLVHGDLSPKNVLVDPGAPDGVWIIDWEVAHYGDPAFDLAFMLTHLTMKSIHLPALTSELDGAAETFLEHYRDAVGSHLAPQMDRVIAHVGCLLMARVLGKSPAEYLTAPQRDASLALGEALLDQDASQLRDLHAIRDRILR